MADKIKTHSKNSSQDKPATKTAASKESAKQKKINQKPSGKQNTYIASGIDKKNYKTTYEKLSDFNFMGGILPTTDEEVIQNNKDNKYRYVVLCYTGQPDFCVAADTWRRELIKSGVPAKNIIVDKYYTAGTIDDFRKPSASYQGDKSFFGAWGRVARETNKTKGIKQAALFGHTGTIGSWNHINHYLNDISPEFIDVQIYMKNESLSAPDISRLPKLNWANGAIFEIRGCRSGVEDKYGDSVANRMLVGQMTANKKLTVTGETGFAAPSYKRDSYKEIESMHYSDKNNSWWRTDKFIYSYDQGIQNPFGHILGLDEGAPRLPQKVYNSWTYKKSKGDK